jgi:tRNA (cmo5U34)-methyltransferase
MAEWQSSEKASAYLQRAHRLPHRAEGEAVLLDVVPLTARRILDLGTGDGRLLALLKQDRPTVEGVALDFSPTMLEAARKRFATDPRVTIVEHDMNMPLPDIGQFDAIVSSFAIHHCPDARKEALYAEIFSRLTPGGIFCNLEHVSSPTESLHDRFLQAFGQTRDTEDKSNILARAETQLDWLRTIGFDDVDCYWKWLELALLVGFKPTA